MHDRLIQGSRERLFWSTTSREELTLLSENYLLKSTFPKDLFINANNNHYSLFRQNQKMASTPLPLSLILKPLKRPLVKLFLITLLCSFSYILGSYKYSTISQTPTSSTLLPQHHSLNCFLLNFTSTLHLNSSPLHFEPQHRVSLPQDHVKDLTLFTFCPSNFSNYCPCQDPSREKQFQVDNKFHRERHCPENSERLRCLIPKPDGYKRPFLWPKSKDFAWFKNVPFPKLTVYKKSQNWVRLERDKFVFPGGGTSFPMGVKGYVDQIKQVLPLKSGSIRTVLDVGCGVSFSRMYLLFLNLTIV